MKNVGKNISGLWDFGKNISKTFSLKYMDYYFPTSPKFLDLPSSYGPVFSVSFATLQVSVMRVGSDTFGNPIFQKGLQN